jgi:hypothetical protein
MPVFLDLPRPGGDAFEPSTNPMTAASIVAIDHELGPPLVTQMVDLGAPFRFRRCRWVALFTDDIEPCRQRDGSN